MELTLKKEITFSKTASSIIGVFSFIIFTSLGAFVRIPLPFTPVPLTLQTFFVLLSGAFLGSNLGAISQLGYIFLGAAGLPIFSGANFGLAYLLGPTGGYLLGFVLASFWLGRFIKYSGNNFYFSFALFCLADLILLSSGVLWMKFIFGYPLKKLLLIGFIPFVFGDLCKALLATLIYAKLKSRPKSIF